MNVKRFTGRTSRDALALVKQAFGEDAVVLSTRPCAEGVEVLAMAPEAMAEIAGMATDAERPAPSMPLAPTPPVTTGARGNSLAKRLAERMRGSNKPGAAAPAAPETEVHQDVEQMAMSTLSFQDYVRERMLKRRRAAMEGEASDSMFAADAAEAAMASGLSGALDHHAAPMRDMREHREARFDAPMHSAPASHAAPVAQSVMAARHALPVPSLHEIDDEPPVEPRRAAAPAARAEPRADTRAQSVADTQAAAQAAMQAASSRREQLDMMQELRSMKGMIEERFGTLAFMERLQRQPRQATLAQRMMDCGFSPALVRRLLDALPENVTDETAWAASVLERNVHAFDGEPGLEDQGGVYALIGSTGVGKTTSTAKLAAAFAAKYGAAHLGLITLDAYRVGAHEQLRAYGRILGVPVHTAHDRASLEDLLELLAGKKMVLIDTAGVARRDARTKELLDMVSHRSIRRLLVIDAAAQGETIDDLVRAWDATKCCGVVLSKIDEAVKLGPAVDAVIRHKLKVWGVANGQRVPEDWHRLSASALVQRALREPARSAWQMRNEDVQLLFAAPPRSGPAGAHA